MSITFVNGLNFEAFDLRVKNASKRGLAAAGLQLINNVVNGSMTQSTRPPIKTGVLRSSGSVFMGSKLIGDTNKDGKGKPCTSHSAPEGDVTVGFNTAYAARWHENKFTPGPKSVRDGNVDYKYLSVHMRDDREELIDLIGRFTKEGL